MKMLRVLVCLSAVAWFGCVASLLAQESGRTPPSSAAPASAPSVQSIIEQLKAPQDADVTTTGTRSLHLGAASAAGAAATQPVAPPAASISMQVQFAFDSDRIEGASATTMENLAAALASPELQGREFQVVGHTDGVGSAAYNLHLSQLRAASVKRYLTTHGVAANRLSARGTGASNLLNTADPAAAENRRVEIIASGG